MSYHNVHIIEGYGSFTGAEGTLSGEQTFVPDVADYKVNMSASKVYRFLSNIGVSTTLAKVEEALQAGSTVLLLCREKQDPTPPVVCHAWLMRPESLTKLNLPPKEQLQ